MINLHNITITNDQIGEISDASQSCHGEGLGLQIVVFSDSSYQQAISDNDVIARGDGNGGWDYPIARIKCPMTYEEVEGYLEYLISQK